MFPVRRRAPARPAPIVPAGIAVFGEAFHDRELGVTGEALPSAPTPAPAAPLRPTIPPPPWEEQLQRGDIDLAALAELTPHKRVSALDAMLAESAEWPEWPLSYERPGTPVERFKPPAADWRQEERERARQNQPPLGAFEPAKSLAPRPARRGKP